MKKILIFILTSLLLFSCTQEIIQKEENISNSKIMNEQNLKEAYFAGGCFWCMEGVFEAQDGVKEAIAGYIGGDKQTASYNQVSRGNTKHREGVKIIYNPDIIRYDTLVELFWTQIDPTDPDGQFTDKGFQYTTAIYYDGDEEKKIAELSKKELQNSGKFDTDIVTKILSITPFFEAEEYHQDYYKKSSERYNTYKKGSGRADFIEENGKKSLNFPLSDAELKKKLTPLQYKVTQEGATEKPFDNEYWDNKEAGIYVDIVDGIPLYSSKDKYKSGTGWPSFTKPIDANNIEQREDNSFFSKRTEIVGANSDAHIGHVFDDGPSELGGLRYCMNSAALRFIAKEDLEKEGYGEYLEGFE